MVFIEVADNKAYLILASIIECLSYYNQISELFQLGVHINSTFTQPKALKMIYHYWLNERE